MSRMETSRSWFVRFWFKMPSEGGIRRIYTIVVAGLECILVSSFKVGLLIELEMLIYALSAALFFYSFVYLRIQRQAKFKYGRSNPDYSSAEEVDLLHKEVSLDAEGESISSEVFNIGGGTGVAVLIVFFPVFAFLSNTVISLMDPAPFKIGSFEFPYFKLLCLTLIISSGLVCQLLNHLIYRRAGHVTTL